MYMYTAAATGRNPFQEIKYSTRIKLNNSNVLAL